jgi:hypothetical protein
MRDEAFGIWDLRCETWDLEFWDLRCETWDVGFEM